MNLISNWQRENYFNDLVRTGEDALFSDKTAPRTVILVRDDILPPLHQGIQAMHAVVALLASDTVKIPAETYLILLGANEQQMMDYPTKIKQRNKKTFMAYRDSGLIEPSSGVCPVTACAFEPMTAEEVRVLFGGLKRAK